MDKRGIAAIVATVSIVLITVGIAVMVWVFVVPVVEKNVQLSDGCVNADLSLEVTQGYTCYDSNLNGVGIQIKKGTKDVNITGAEFIFSYGGDSVRIRKYFELKNNEVKTFYFNISIIGLSDLERISMVPVVQYGEKEKKCDVVSFVELKSTDCNLSSKTFENLTLSSDGGYVADGGSSGGGGCILDSECGTPFNSFGYCLGGDVWMNYTNFTCLDSSCQTNIYPFFSDNCSLGCLWGACVMLGNGTVISYQEIGSTEGNFTEALELSDYFGSSVASISDLDGNGVQDLAIGVRGDDDGGTNRGAVYILFMNQNGTVKSHQKISDTQGEFIAIFDDGDYFSYSIALVSDLDVDGVQDLAVGARNDETSGITSGAVWILNLG